GSSSALAGWASRPGRAGGPHGTSLSARHHPPSSPARWASPRTQPPATRFSQAPTGPPTPVAAHLWPHPNTAVYQFREFSLAERPGREMRGRWGSDGPDHRGFAVSTG